jgi:hypothetical protein
MRIFPSLLAILPCLALFSAKAEAHPRGYMQRLQNDLADRYHLPRFQSLGQLNAYIKSGKLVRVEPTAAYEFDKTFAEKDPDHRAAYAHVWPWTKAFLDKELSALHAEYGTRYVITSEVRTQPYQNLLCSSRHGGKNVNAICGCTGWHRSAHLTGAAVDIGRVGLSEKEQAAIRHRLDALWAQGKLVYIQENGSQYCFHIMVLPPYAMHPADAATEQGPSARSKKRRHAGRR